MLVKRLLPEAGNRLVTIPDGAPLIEAAKLLRTGTELVVVCSPAGTVIGVITKTDVVTQISHCHGASCVTPASSVMTRNVVLCRPEDWLQDVWLRMKEQGLKNIPVADQDTRPLGVLNARDVLQVLLQEVQDEESLLRDYVMSVGYR
jgi:predicted transcriptional regulator